MRRLNEHWKFMQKWQSQLLVDTQLMFKKTHDLVAENLDLKKRLNIASELAKGIMCVQLLKLPSDILVKYKIDADEIDEKFDRALKIK